MENNEYKDQEVQSFEIENKYKPFTFPAQQLRFEAAPGTLCIIALARYYSEKTFAGNAVINNKKLSPAAILKADFCPGELVKQDDWFEMAFNEKKKRKKVVKAKKKIDDKTN